MVTPVRSFCDYLQSATLVATLKKLGGISEPGHVAIHLPFQVFNDYVEKHVSQHRSCRSLAGL